jgi:hypothetical protein
MNARKAHTVKHPSVAMGMLAEYRKYFCKLTKIGSTTTDTMAVVSIVEEHHKRKFSKRS